MKMTILKIVFCSRTPRNYNSSDSGGPSSVSEDRRPSISEVRGYQSLAPSPSDAVQSQLAPSSRTSISYPGGSVSSSGNTLQSYPEPGEQPWSLNREVALVPVAEPASVERFPGCSALQGYPCDFDDINLLPRAKRIRSDDRKLEGSSCLFICQRKPEVDLEELNRLLREKRAKDKANALIVWKNEDHERAKRLAAHCRTSLGFFSIRDLSQSDCQGLNALVWPPPEAMLLTLRDSRAEFTAACFAKRPKMQHHIQKPTVEVETLWRNSLRAYHKIEKKPRRSGAGRAEKPCRKYSPGDFDTRGVDHAANEDYPYKSGGSLPAQDEGYAADENANLRKVLHSGESYSSQKAKDGTYGRQRSPVHRQLHSDMGGGRHSRHWNQEEVTELHENRPSSGSNFHDGNKDLSTRECHAWYSGNTVYSHDWDPGNQVPGQPWYLRREVSGHFLEPRYHGPGQQPWSPQYQGTPQKHFGTQGADIAYLSKSPLHAPNRSKWLKSGDISSSPQSTHQETFSGITGEALGTFPLLPAGLLGNLLHSETPAAYDAVMLSSILDSVSQETCLSLDQHTAKRARLPESHQDEKVHSHSNPEQSENPRTADVRLDHVAHTVMAINPIKSEVERKLHVGTKGTSSRAVTKNSLRDVKVKVCREKPTEKRKPEVEVSSQAEGQVAGMVLPGKKEIDSTTSGDGDNFSYSRRTEGPATRKRLSFTPRIAPNSKDALGTPREKTPSRAPTLKRSLPSELRGPEKPTIVKKLHYVRNDPHSKTEPHQSPPGIITPRKPLGLSGRKRGTERSNVKPMTPLKASNKRTYSTPRKELFSKFHKSSDHQNSKSPDYEDFKFDMGQIPDKSQAQGKVLPSDIEAIAAQLKDEDRVISEPLTVMRVDSIMILPFDDTRAKAEESRTQISTQEETKNPEPVIAPEPKGSCLSSLATRDDENFSDSQFSQTTALHSESILNLPSFNSQGQMFHGPIPAAAFNNMNRANQLPSPSDKNSRNSESSLLSEDQSDLGGSDGTSSPPEEEPAGLKRRRISRNTFSGMPTKTRKRREGAKGSFVRPLLKSDLITSFSSTDTGDQRAKLEEIPDRPPGYVRKREPSKGSFVRPILKKSLENDSWSGQNVWELSSSAATTTSHGDDDSLASFVTEMPQGGLRQDNVVMGTAKLSKPSIEREVTEDDHAIAGHGQGVVSIGHSGSRLSLTKSSSVAGDLAYVRTSVSIPSIGQLRAVDKVPERSLKGTPMKDEGIQVQSLEISALEHLFASDNRVQDSNVRRPPMTDEGTQFQLSAEAASEKDPSRDPQSRPLARPSLNDNGSSYSKPGLYQVLEPETSFGGNLFATFRTKSVFLLDESPQAHKSRQDTQSVTTSSPSENSEATGKSPLEGTLSSSPKMSLSSSVKESLDTLHALEESDDEHIPLHIKIHSFLHSMTSRHNTMELDNLIVQESSMNSSSSYERASEDEPDFEGSKTGVVLTNSATSSSLNDFKDADRTNPGEGPDIATSERTYVSSCSDSPFPMIREAVESRHILETPETEALELSSVSQQEKILSPNIWDDSESSPDLDKTSRQTLMESSGFSNPEIAMSSAQVGSSTVGGPKVVLSLNSHSEMQSSGRHLSVLGLVPDLPMVKVSVAKPAKLRSEFHLSSSAVDDPLDAVMPDPVLNVPAIEHGQPTVVNSHSEMQSSSALPKSAGLSSDEETMSSEHSDEGPKHIKIHSFLHSMASRSRSVELDALIMSQSSFNVQDQSSSQEVKAAREGSTSNVLSPELSPKPVDKYVLDSIPVLVKPPSESAASTRVKPESGERLSVTKTPSDDSSVALLEDPSNKDSDRVPKPIKIHSILHSMASRSRSVELDTLILSESGLDSQAEYPESSSYGTPGTRDRSASNPLSPYLRRGRVDNTKIDMVHKEIAKPNRGHGESRVSASLTEQEFPGNQVDFVNRPANEQADKGPKHIKIHSILHSMASRSRSVEPDALIFGQSEPEILDQSSSLGVTGTSEVTTSNPLSTHSYPESVDNADSDLVPVPKKPFTKKTEPRILNPQTRTSMTSTDDVAYPPVEQLEKIPQLHSFLHSMAPRSRSVELDNLILSQIGHDVEDHPTNYELHTSLDSDFSPWNGRSENRDYKLSSEATKVGLPGVRLEISAVSQKERKSTLNFKRPAVETSELTSPRTNAPLLSREKLDRIHIVGQAAVNSVSSLVVSPHMSFNSTAVQPPSPDIASLSTEGQGHRQSRLLEEHIDAQNHPPRGIEINSFLNSLATRSRSVELDNLLSLGLGGNQLIPSERQKESHELSTSSSSINHSHRSVTQHPEVFSSLANQEGDPDTDDVHVLLGPAIIEREDVSPSSSFREEFEVPSNPRCDLRQPTVELSQISSLSSHTNISLSEMSAPISQISLSSSALFTDAVHVSPTDSTTVEDPQVTEGSSSSFLSWTSDVSPSSSFWEEYDAPSSPQDLIEHTLEVSKMSSLKSDADISLSSSEQSTEADPVSPRPAKTVQNLGVTDSRDLPAHRNSVMFMNGINICPANEQQLPTSGTSSLSHLRSQSEISSLSSDLESATGLIDGKSHGVEQLDSFNSSLSSSFDPSEMSGIDYSSDVDHPISTSSLSEQFIRGSNLEDRVRIFDGQNSQSPTQSTRSPSMLLGPSLRRLWYANKPPELFSEIAAVAQHLLVGLGIAVALPLTKPGLAQKLLEVPSEIKATEQKLFYVHATPVAGEQPRRKTEVRRALETEVRGSNTCPRKLFFRENVGEVVASAARSLSGVQFRCETEIRTEDSSLLLADKSKTGANMSEISAPLFSSNPLSPKFFKVTKSDTIVRNKPTVVGGTERDSPSQFLVSLKEDTGLKGLSPDGHVATRDSGLKGISQDGHHSTRDSYLKTIIVKKRKVFFDLLMEQASPTSNGIFVDFPITGVGLRVEQHSGFVDLTSTTSQGPGSVSIALDTVPQTQSQSPGQDASIPPPSHSSSYQPSSGQVPKPTASGWVPIWKFDRYADFPPAPLSKVSRNNGEAPPPSTPADGPPSTPPDQVEFLQAFWGREMSHLDIYDTLAAKRSQGHGENSD